MLTTDTKSRNSNEQVVFRDYPLILWLMGALSVVIGISIRESIMLRLVFLLMGTAAIGFMSVLTVTVDHTLGTLNLYYHALFRVLRKCTLCTMSSSLTLSKIVAKALIESNWAFDRVRSFLYEVRTR